MDKSPKKHSDYLLSLVIFALMAFGLIMIYSVSKYTSLQMTDGATDKYYLVKQLRWVGLGLIGWIIFQSIDYRFWLKKSSVFLYATIILLLLPLFPFGHGGGAGERWFGWGWATFQPSEAAKLTFILYISAWFASAGSDLKKIEKMFWPFIIVMVGVAGLMLIQKDLGTLAVIVAIAAAIFLMAGAPVYQFLAGIGGAGFLLWIAIKLEPYRMERFLTFLNPEQNELGSSYHIRNALIAIGSGSWFGLGFGQSKQKYLYLPESHTDSIFAITVEELGFLRSALIVMAFAFIAIRGYQIAKNAPDIYSRLVATGITTWLTFQMVINIGAMLSLMPLTGIPLPFISYGGSSLLILLAAVGILINISKNGNNQLRKRVPR